MSRALIVEDDAVFRDALGRALERAGHETLIVSGVSDAERHVARWNPGARGGRLEARGRVGDRCRPCPQEVCPEMSNGTC